MQFQKHVIGLATLLVLIGLGASAAAASPATSATSTAPVVASLDDVSVIDSPSHHCGPNESHVDPFYCIYNPPCDGTCVEAGARGGAYVR